LAESKEIKEDLQLKRAPIYASGKEKAKRFRAKLLKRFSIRFRILCGLYLMQQCFVSLIGYFFLTWIIHKTLPPRL